MIVTEGEPVALFTQDQVYDLCRDVGFKHRAARIASAIAMCESPKFLDGVAHSDFDAVGDQDLADDTWGFSYSGWQIRSLRADKGTGRWRDEDELVRPRFAARAAREIQRSQGWKAWTTYTSHQYRAYMQAEFPPPPGTYVVMSGDTLSGIADKLGGFTWQELAAAQNPVIPPPYFLQIGQILILPTGGAAA